MVGFAATVNFPSEDISEAAASGAKSNDLDSNLISNFDNTLGSLSILPVMSKDFPLRVSVKSRLVFTGA